MKDGGSLGKVEALVVLFLQQCELIMVNVYVYTRYNTNSRSWMSCTGSGCRLVLESLVVIYSSCEPGPCVRIPTRMATGVYELVRLLSEAS